jgi:hypothetical protein
MGSGIGQRAGGAAGTKTAAPAAMMKEILIAAV